MSETETITESPSIINKDGTFAENWYEKYGEDNKDYLSRYDSLDKLVNANISARKKISRDPDTLIQIPDENSSDDVKATFRKAYGWSDSLDDYSYEMPDDLKTKLEPIDETRMATFKEFAQKELEISPAKFKKLLDFYHKDVAQAIDKYDVVFNEQKAEDADKAKAELMKQDGWRTDAEYEDKVLMANAILRKYGGADAVASFNAENSPQMTKFLNNIAEAMSEDTLKGVGPTTGPTRGDLQSQINDVRREMDKIMSENPVNFKMSPKYKELKEKKKNLYAQMKK